MLPNGLAVLNGKGGVLKTTISAHVAALAALGGWKVLVVDLDPQGNLVVDLGIKSDGGEGLLAAVRDSVPLEPHRDVRPNLDVVPAGPSTARMAEHLRVARADEAFPRYDHLERALAPIASDYNLVVLDCPPGDRVLHAEALCAAHFLIVPTQPDVASINGLAATFRAFLEAKSSANRDLEMLGIVLGPVGSTASKVREDAETLLAELVGEHVPVFDQTIRLAQAPAVQARRLGVLVHELAELKRQGPKWYELPKEERSRRRIADAQHLAGDYTSLTRQILEQFLQHSAGAINTVEEQ